MSDTAKDTCPDAATDNATPVPDEAAANTKKAKDERQESRRWWLKLVVQPILFLVCGVVLLIGLGVAQQFGWISGGGGSGGGHASSGDENVQYICPMMCTPPQSEPGRCPVCAMELVPATAGGGGDSRSIEIDPAARRVANIQTAPVEAMSMARTIRVVGELTYDEGTLKTLSAYVDGRLDRLYADYTGVVVNKGDHLALVYSPRLYSGQAELLLAKKAKHDSQSTTLTRVLQSNREMYESAKQRLIELGMTVSQINELEKAGSANSRLHLCAPISGTVIEKFAEEGQYVKEGQAIYKLADLSTLWLMLELFPEDAVSIRYGQKVEAEMQSLPGRIFTGRVAFVDPKVNPKTRTVGVSRCDPKRDRSSTSWRLCESEHCGTALRQSAGIDLRSRVGKQMDQPATSTRGRVVGWCLSSLWRASCFPRLSLASPIRKVSMAEHSWFLAVRC